MRDFIVCNFYRVSSPDYGKGVIKIEPSSKFTVLQRLLYGPALFSRAGTCFITHLLALIGAAARRHIARFELRALYHNLHIGVMAKARHSNEY